MLVRPCHNAQMVKLTMLTLISGVPFTHMSGYAKFSWALLASGKARWSVSQMQCSQDVLALSGGLALAPPLISSVAFTRGTSWSSSRNTFKPFSRTTCRLTGELRVFLVQCKQTVCAPPVGLLQSMQMTLLKST